MALQVKYPLSGDRAQFALYDGAELAVSCPQVIKAIAAWPSMQRDQLVPVRSVARSPVLSGHFVSSPSSDHAPMCHATKIAPRWKLLPNLYLRRTLES
jgi:hypothetical protein